MSLEDLLREPENSSAWKDQKKRFFRILLGLLIIAIGLIAAVAILFFMKQDKNQNLLHSKQESEVKSLTELMHLKNETQGLKNDINNMRAAVTAPHVQVSSLQVRAPIDLSSAPQIINFDPGEGFTALSSAKKDYYIPTGAVFRARLITPIKTSVERSFVLAETTHEYRMDMNRKIPKGSRLIGRARLNPILKGVIVEFNTLVLPNGIETTINGMALSRNALPEIDGLYFSDDLQNYGAALAFGFLSGFADASRTKEPTALGYLSEDTASNKVLSGLSTASFQVAESILQDIRTRAVEYVVVPAGEPVFVALTSRYNMNQRSSK